MEVQGLAGASACGCVAPSRGCNLGWVLSNGHCHFFASGRDRKGLNLNGCEMM